ncbi:MULTISPECIES: diversity-generating retroelement protein Avd [Caloramator]|uniref:bAvd-like domain-containing protein n=1 Tax=Caloramator australicus RC3 TaxID=857293 RepID=I7LG09_9CLOT|nr:MULTISPECIES: diversity-generating retroelement protein Avd [Caloramator]MDO6355265.1 diversity-generating retroelement protein Avd [Caloramator sp. CAR-1]CCJ32905.1 FIG00601690: hypothetical protein [Caloramator australicus RC3]
MQQDFKLLQKTYDMILYGNICLQQFPKHEKHVLAADIRKSMYKLLELIVRANKKYYKKTTLEEIDIEIDVLRNLIRLSADSQLRYLPIKKYENWSKMLNEIGKMLGGWIKRTNN